MRKAICAALVAAGLMACALPAGAATVMDVNNYKAFFPVSGWDASSYYQGGPFPFDYLHTNLYQTWTVGVSGQLTGIDIYGRYQGANGNFRVEVFKGGNPTAAGAFSSANLLGLVSRPFTTPQPPGVAYAMSFDFTSADIFAEAGDKLTFRMSVDPCATPTCVRRFTTYPNGSGGQTTNGYAGGGLFTKQGFGGITALNSDANFRTFMAPVPEPSTWATLIVGLGAAGSVLRRRRAASRPTRLRQAAAWAASAAGSRIR